MIVDFQAPSIGTMVEERGRAPFLSNKERVMVYGYTQSAIRLFCAATARPRHHPIPRWQNLLLLSSNPRSTRNLEEFLNRLKDLRRKSAKRRKCVAQKRSKRITGQPMAIWFMLRVFLSHYCTLLPFFFFFTIGNRIPFCLRIYIYIYFFMLYYRWGFSPFPISIYWSIGIRDRLEKLTSTCVDYQVSSRYTISYNFISFINIIFFISD